MSFPVGHVVARQAVEPEEMDEAAREAAWTQECLVLGRSFASRIAAGHTSRAQLGFVSVSPGVVLHTAAPAGTQVFALGLPSGGGSAVHYGGRPLGAQEVIAVRGGRESEFRFPRAVDYLLFTTTAEMAERAAQALWGCSLAEGAGEGRLPPRSAPAAERLRAIWCASVAHTLERPERLRDPGFSRLLEEEVLEALLLGVGPPRAWPSPPLRQQLARRAEDYLRAHLDRPVGLRELCEAIGASERTLHLGFRERYGVSPKTYLTQLRLRGVRRELLDAAPGTRVTDAAIRWGFTHLGRFSVLYHRRFGEKASHTLRASRPRALEGSRPVPTPSRSARNAGCSARHQLG